LYGIYILPFKLRRRWGHAIQEQEEGENIGSLKANRKGRGPEFKKEEREATRRGSFFPDGRLPRGKESSGKCVETKGMTEG